MLVLFDYTWHTVFNGTVQSFGIPNKYELIHNCFIPWSNYIAPFVRSRTKYHLFLFASLKSTGSRKPCMKSFLQIYINPFKTFAQKWQNACSCSKLLLCLNPKLQNNHFSSHNTSPNFNRFQIDFYSIYFCHLHKKILSPELTYLNSLNEKWIHLQTTWSKKSIMSCQ